MAVDRVFTDLDLAALYDLWHPPSDRADFDFYHPMIMAAGSVLDVGCGTGAMLHRAREAGHTGLLCGLDPAPGMLAQARRRGDIEWVEGDLSSVDWTDEFDLIVMTGHAFQVLLDEEDIRVALRAVHRALTATGRFAFETRNPAARAWEAWTPENAVDVPDGSGAMIHIETHLVEPFDGRTVSFTHSFSRSGWQSPRVSRSTLRFLDTDCLLLMLAEAGFVAEQQRGDWIAESYEHNAPEIIIVARKT